MLIPNWPAPAHVRAAFSLREGGVSSPPYDGLNLGDHVGDDPHAVRTNRERFAQAVGARPVFLQQVHGTGVITLADDTPDGAVADGVVCAQPMLACTIMVADCLPVLFTDRDGTAVAAAHAGWRGLAGEGGHGILEAVWQQFRTVGTPAAPRRAADTLAWLGPCIGPQAFEVGPEVRAQFMGHDASAARYFQRGAGDRWLADLPGLARARLQALGIEAIHGNDGSASWCTVSNPLRFFSHRRDRVSGRLAASVWFAG